MPRASFVSICVHLWFPSAALCGLSFPPAWRLVLGASFVVGAFAEKFLQAFIPLFVAIDPIGISAIFLGLGQGMAPAQRQRMI